MGQKPMSGKKNKIFYQLVTMVTIAIVPKLIRSLFTLDARKQFLILIFMTGYGSYSRAPIMQATILTSKKGV